MARAAATSIERIKACACGAAQRRAIGLVRKIEIVAVTAPAGEEAQILLAAYRLSDPYLHDFYGFTADRRYLTGCRRFLHHGRRPVVGKALP